MGKTRSALFLRKASFRHLVCFEKTMLPRACFDAQEHSCLL